MGLTELYRETGERRYLDLARFFLDQRGHGWLGPGRYASSAYYQDRVPEGIEVVRASGSRVDTASWRGRLYRPVGSGAPPARRTPS